MPAKIETTTRKLAMYRDAVNGTTVFLENPVYGYYRISSLENVTFEILSEEMRIQAENDILREAVEVQKKQLEDLKRHLGHTGKD